MEFSLDYRPYRFKLNQPIALGMLVTGYREGIIIRLIDDSGKTGFGEIAPVESFGSEPLENAQTKLDSFYGRVTLDAISTLYQEGYGCTQFALRSAVKSIFKTAAYPQSEVYSAALLPIETNPFSKELRACKAQGYRSIKYKLRPEAQGGISYKGLVELLDAVQDTGLKIRLDANETLSLEESKRALEILEGYSHSIDFLEQPLDRMLVAEMIDLSYEYNIPIALDESLSTMGREICSYSMPESMVWVIKPSLGDLNLLSDSHKNPLVYSSVFETAIGFSAILELQDSTYDGGLGTQSYFEDSSVVYPSSGMPVQTGLWTQAMSETLWNRLQ